jgi:hypothetical protein
MASREEQKRRLREERQAREAAEARKAANKRRLQLVFGAVLGLAAVAAVVFAIAGGGDGGGDGGAALAGDAVDGVQEVAIPARRTTDLEDAARRAGCELKTGLEIEGRDHIGDNETFDGYKTNPPTSGTHRLTWTEDGFYAPGQQPNKNNWVHALEHGRVLFQYAPGTSTRNVGQLLTLFNEDFQGTPGYHQLVLQNDTQMPYRVAAVAWGNMVGCPDYSDEVWDVLRAFRERFVDKGPEQIP